MTHRTRLIAAAATAAAAATPLVLAAGGHAQAPTGRTLTLQVSDTKISTVDVPPLIHSRKSPETPGDEVIGVSKVSGTASGRLYLHCTVVVKGASVERATYSCAGTYVLADGTIDAAGVVRLDKPATAAITGGTGAYAGARGTLSTTPSGTDTLTLG
jgi:hypothetical protein